MSGAAKQAPAATGGLRVEKSYSGTGWVITHLQSGLDCGIWVRLQRQAQDAMTELLATGEDFTLTKAELMRKALQRRPEALAVGTVLARWRERCLHCCDGDEHYSWQTYAMDGRCMGPMSNGKPRRS